MTLVSGNIVSAGSFEQFCNKQWQETAEKPPMTQFQTGATRSSDEGKNDYEGYISFPVLEEFGEYMRRHQIQADGKKRESDNWQKGMPVLSYRKSFVRHALELWGLFRGHISSRLKAEYPGKPLDFLIRETACACFFNLQGLIHEYLKANTSGQPLTEAQKAELLDRINRKFEDERAV